MRKRVSERVPPNVEVKFLFENRVYSGTVMGLSEKGMSIRAGWDAPVDFEENFEVLILHREKRIMVPVKLERLAATDKYNNIIKIEVLNPPREYLELAGGRGTGYKVYRGIARKLLRG